MKYLDTPILQCEIQELPEPYTHGYSGRVPVAACRGLRSPRDMSRLLLTEPRPWAGCAADPAQPFAPTFCRAPSSALHNVRRLCFIHLYCHAVRTSLYLWVIRRALWKVNIRTWPQDKKNPLHSFSQSTYCSTGAATTKRNSIQNSRSTAFFL